MGKQPEQGVNKPSATLVEQGSAARMSQDDLEEAKHQAEANAIRFKNENKLNKQMGKIAQMLSQNHVITDVTFPYLTMGQTQLSVSEYYPKLKIVVDKFYGWNADIEKQVEFKKKAFAKNSHLKYGYVNPSLSLIDLAEQLGIVTDEPELAAK